MMQKALRFTSKAMFLAVIIGLSCSAFGVLTTVPAGLGVGDQYRLVFVTAGVRDASSSAISDYNTFVTSQANGSAALASLGVTWSVIGSTSSVDAIDNTGTDPISAGVPIYTVSGQLVASGNADLWDGVLAAAINVDQNGNLLQQKVFTGTGINGLGLADRQLGANGDRVQWGESSQVTSGWTTIDWLGSLTGLHYYGISDVMTVVPEPATIALLGFGGLVLRRKR